MSTTHGHLGPLVGWHALPGARAAVKQEPFGMSAVVVEGNIAAAEQVDAAAAEKASASLQSVAERFSHAIACAVLSTVMKVRTSGHQSVQ